MDLNLNLNSGSKMIRVVDPVPINFTSNFAATFMTKSFLGQEMLSSSRLLKQRISDISCHSTFLN